MELERKAFYRYKTEFKVNNFEPNTAFLDVDKPKTFNLLDLDDDVLNIIGKYVKADNNIREFNELIKKTYLIMLI